MGGGMMMGGGTMPASMGMMMLGRLIMSLVGDRDSWNQMSLMSGMMGGMGMMGGGMGMMGGGMGGGMGGMGRRIPLGPADEPAVRHAQAEPDPPPADAAGRPVGPQPRRPLGDAAEGRAAEARRHQPDRHEPEGPEGA